MLFVLVAGRAAGRAVLKVANGGILVFGAKPGSSGSPSELRGAAATEELCLKGYERMKHTLAVSTGYGQRLNIRVEALCRAALFLGVVRARLVNEQYGPVDP